MKPLIPIFAILFLASCATPSERTQALIAQYNQAEQAQKKAQADVNGKAADLNRGAVYAISLNDDATAKRILDAQLQLTGPQVTTEAVLEQEVNDLRKDNTRLLDNVKDIAAQLKEKTDSEDKMRKNLEDLATKQALMADQEQRDNSWGGLYGLIRHGKQSLWTLFFCGIGLIVFVLLLRVASIWFPEIGLVLSGIEKFFAFIFTCIARIIPGVISEAGWVVKEVESSFQPKTAPSAPPASSQSNIAQAQQPNPGDPNVKPS